MRELGPGRPARMPDEAVGEMTDAAKLVLVENALDEGVEAVAEDGDAALREVARELEEMGIDLDVVDELRHLLQGERPDAANLPFQAFLGADLHVAPKSLDLEPLGRREGVEKKIDHVVLRDRAVKIAENVDGGRGHSLEVGTPL